MNPKHRLMLQGGILVAFLFFNPFVIGSLYVTFLVMRGCMPKLIDGFLYFALMSVIIGLITFVMQLVMPVFHYAILTMLFAGSMTFIFGKPPRLKLNGNSHRKFKSHTDDNVIDVEVISSRTIYH
jgi:uncharacterized protein YebE (UPF0316 family)